MIHLTITTGHTRQSPRDEVDRSILGLCQDAILPALLSGKKAKLPRLPNNWLTGTSHEGGLVATAWVNHQGEPAPIATWWIATDQTSANELWKVAMTYCREVAVLTGQAMPQVGKPVTTPWVAAWIEIGAIFDPSSFSWVADLERYLAWAWLDHCRTKS